MQLFDCYYSLAFCVFFAGRFNRLNIDGGG